MNWWVIVERGGSIGVVSKVGCIKMVLVLRILFSKCLHGYAYHRFAFLDALLTNSGSVNMMS